MSRPPPTGKEEEPPRPLVPLDIIDAPTQRLYLVGIIVLIQSYKLSQFLSSSSSETALWKWIVIDLIMVSMIKRLRIPRLNWGWKSRYSLTLLLFCFNYTLFGTWTFNRSSILTLFPSSIKSLLTHYYSTAERSVRLSKVLGKQTSHLGGQYTVHILAVSTAILNPLSTSYCRFKQGGEATLIPLLLNNTSPSKLTYSITSLQDPTSSREITIPASQLIKHPHHLHSNKQQDASSSRHDDDDDLALAAQWSLQLQQQPISSDKKKNLHHPLLTSSSSSSLTSFPESKNSINDNSFDPSSSDHPFSSLTSTESLYYLPILTRGHVELVSILDTQGHPIRIRRKRSTSSSSSSTFESTLITDCPQAGLSLSESRGKKVEHRCLISPASSGSSSSPSPSFNLEQSLSLGLVVKGNEPLKIVWSSIKHGGGGKKQIESLEGIVRGDGDADDELIRVPLNVSLQTSGRTDYFIEKVIDSFGNEVNYGASSSSSSSSLLLQGTVKERSVIVHKLPRVEFVGECRKGELSGGGQVQLLYGKKKKLQMKLSGIEEGEEFQGIVTLKFTPPPPPTTTTTSSVSEGWTREIKLKGVKSSLIQEVEVSEPGLYEILSVSSQYCKGEVLVPNTCQLVLQPLPTLSTSFKVLNDVCSSPTGLLTSLHLTGVAPFTVYYTLTKLNTPGHHNTVTHHVHRLSHSRDEFKLQPPGPGDWEIKFNKIEDKFYKKLELDQSDANGEYTKRLRVEEVAEAKWKESEIVLHSCSQQQQQQQEQSIKVELELKGSQPWSIEYSIIGQGQAPSQSKLVEGITKSPHVMEIEIPELISQQGGQFSISLETVTDSNGCKRPLTTSRDLIVQVRRSKPSVRFNGINDKKELIIREGDEARLPIRLTGEGPWTIDYSTPTSASKINTFKAHQPNVDLLIPSAVSGTYRLVSVRDKFCPGDVVDNANEWKVGILERPRVGFNEKTTSRNKVVKGGVIKRQGVCQNKVDHVELNFEGKAPFKASYTLSKNSQSPAATHTLQAIQPRASLTLFTAEPGLHQYELISISDSLYTSPSSSGLIQPLKLEQEVWGLPTAHFSHFAKHGFCVQDELISRSSDDLVLELSGQSPFTIELQVKEQGKKGTKEFKIPDIKSKHWAISLPFKLNNPNFYSIAVRRIVDSHGCETLYDSAPSPPPTTTNVDLVSNKKIQNKSNFAYLTVSETATISPVTSQIDHCVGDFLDFNIQGSPPFTVKYEFKGKQHSVPLKSGSKFSRLATEEGTFKILSVGRGQDQQCRTNKIDLVKQIHPIPSAQVSTGESIVVDIREGDQTEIVFSFTGTPPFSFTYSRRAPIDRSKDKKILETHTVTGIEENSYSILTSQEGTYSVSYIADKYCSYPPASKSGAVVRT